MDDVFNSDVGLDGPGLQFPGRPIIALSETNSQMPFLEMEKKEERSKSPYLHLQKQPCDEIPR